MNSFDYDFFYDRYDSFAVSKEKYSRENAIKIASHKMAIPYTKCKFLAIGDGFVRHKAGIDVDNNSRICWWLEYRKHNKSCPCYVFHLSNDDDEWSSEDYDYINIKKLLDSMKM